MPYIEYSPTRRLVGGTGSNGKLEGWDLANYDTDPKEDSKHHQPLDGSDGETIFLSERDVIRVTAGMIHKSELSKWREFKSSTAAGETFTLDVFGTELAPSDPITVKRDPNGYSESRAGDNPFFFNISITCSYKAY